jgi:hypothetical protein
MNELRTKARDTGWRRRRRTIPTRLIDVVVAAIFAVIVTAFAVDSPSRTPDIAIKNGTPYDVTIKVSDGNGDDWMGFALVDAQSEVVVRAPVDHGSEWTLSFGRGGEYPITRSELEQAGWRMRVPDAVAERLAAAGIAPSPQRGER